MDVRTSVTQLLQQLVRHSSRAGVDVYPPVLAEVKGWLQKRGVACRDLKRGDETVGLVAVVKGATASPVYMLNATLDTAGFGNPDRWHDEPTSGNIREGWMYGRGSADSKAGVAIFAHVAAEMAARRGGWAGQLVLLFDLDEHTGQFGGVRQYFEGGDFPRPDGVFIGYPGNNRIVVGSRGFARAVITVHGRSAHSGGSRDRGVNAVVRAARLALDLTNSPLREGRVRDIDEFGLPPQLTITQITGGQGFSAVPDVCRVSVDVRLTPRFTEQDAHQTCERVVALLNEESPDVPPCQAEWQPGWPAYRISDQHPIVSSLRTAAVREFGRDTPTAVVGPSNVGNYLHSLGIAATCGFGASYRSIHATDECVDLSTIEPVYRTYRAALEALFTPV